MTSTAAPQIDDLTALLALNELLPTGYSIWTEPYTDPGFTDIRRYAVWHKPAPKVPAGADARTRVLARRRAEALRRQVGIIIDTYGDGTAWETFRPSTGRQAINGLRSLGEWRYLSAAAAELVRIDRRQPRGDDQWRIR